MVIRESEFKNYTYEERMNLIHTFNNTVYKQFAEEDGFLAIYSPDGRCCVKIPGFKAAVMGLDALDFYTDEEYFNAAKAGYIKGVRVIVEDGKEYLTF